MRPATFTLLLLLTTIIAGCRKTQTYPEFINTAVKVTDRNPELALDNLKECRDDTIGAEEHVRMKYELTRLRALNKAYIDPTPEDTLCINRLIDYYKEHSNTAELTAAYYVKGCHLMDDRPRESTRWLLQAWSTQDTTAADFDVALYNAIVCQMRNICELLYLEKEHEQWGRRTKPERDSMKFDLYINKALVYKHKKQTDSATYYFDKAFEDIKRKKEQTPEVFLSLMSQTTYFVGRGDTAQVLRREPLYRKTFPKNPRGIACLHIAYFYEFLGKRDSCIMLHQKGAATGNTRVRQDAYRMLSETYTRFGQLDSAAKYTHKYDSMRTTNMDKLQEDAAAVLAMIRMSEEWPHMKAEAEKEVTKHYTQRATCTVLSLLAAFIAILTVTMRLTARRHTRKLAQCKKEYELMYAAQEHKTAALTEKVRIADEENNTLKIKISQYEKQQRLNNLYGNETMRRLHELLSKKIALSNKDAHATFALVGNTYPDTMKELDSPKHSLNRHQRLMCALILLRFKTCEISQLMGISPQSVCNIRNRISAKIGKSNEMLALLLTKDKQDDDSPDETYDPEEALDGQPPVSGTDWPAYDDCEA